MPLSSTIYVLAIPFFMFLFLGLVGVKMPRKITGVIGVLGMAVTTVWAYAIAFTYFFGNGEGQMLDGVRQQIVTMPDYFQGYSTKVHFISEEEMAARHSTLHHGGTMIRSARTGWQDEHTALYELRLKMDSNPEFCGGIMCACARAAFRLNSEGQAGCRTIFDIPASKIFYGSRRQLISML